MKILHLEILALYGSTSGVRDDIYTCIIIYLKVHLACMPTLLYSTIVL